MVLAWLGPVAAPLVAQTETAGPVAPDASGAAADDIVVYPAAFFSRYRPNSALDMLNQLPGFRLAKSGELRGYGTDTGNVLINGRRPSAKRVTVASILDRIPASQVGRIELIRGPVRDIELLGEPEVANVILLADTPAAVRWYVTAYENSDTSPMPWFSNVSISDRWNEIDYNAALDVFRVVYSDRNDEQIVDGAGNPTETRLENGHEKEFEANFDLTASRQFGETLVTYSHQIGIQDGSEKFVSRRTPLAGEPGAEIIDGDSDEFQYELGLTAERMLRPGLKGNFLVFYSQEDENSDTRGRRIDASGVPTAERLKDTNQVEKEGILRSEFEWTAWPKHTIRLNIEGTYNQVANTEIETEDTGDGPLPVFVPGANTTIEEHRGDILLKDIWTFGDYELDYGLGAEVSRLAQTGDADVERNLSYLKPHAEFSYTPDEARRTRFRIAREVAQLDFEDFISASVLEDEDLALGNPDLKPETTWISEFGFEQRFGKKSVVKVTLFHHWISDVQDFVPITLTEEAPGNIGDGRRWGIEVESTAALDGLGIRNARVDINARWQDSAVTDPVTGEERVLSATIFRGSQGTIFDTDSEYAATIDFRQDLEKSRVAWGLGAVYEADLIIFKVNELDVRDREPEINLFVETTRWLGLKIRLEYNNILDRIEARQRSLYEVERDLSPLVRRQLQDRTDGREIGLTLSGTF
jgi:outer membrane receptor protein involved in Fe transport